MEYRIWNIEYWILVFQNSKFKITESVDSRLGRCSTRRGFTLLETMVAIAILLIAVVGPISIIGSSLSKIYFVRDQVTAINLAQEAIEVVRQKRDSNFLAGSPTNWDDGFGAGDCKGGPICIVDINPLPNIIKCTGSCPAANSRVYKAPTDPFYHQYYPIIPPGSIATSFTRQMETIKAPGFDEYTVMVTVGWTTGNIPGSVTVSEDIFKWAQ